MANTAFDHASALTIPGSTTNNGLVRWGDTTGTSFGNITGITSDGSNITLLTRGEIRFSDADSSNFIALESPATVGTSYTMTLPAAVPSAADYLKVTSYSGGAGVLEWASVSADTNTTYLTSWVDSSTNAILRLTPSSGSADDLTITAGTNITLTPSGDNLTIDAAGGGPSQANQAALEGETNQDTYAPPDLIKHSLGMAKFWAKYETTGAHSMSVSYNLASITDGGAAGDSDWVIADDMSGSDYVIIGGGVTNPAMPLWNTVSAAGTFTTIIRDMYDNNSLDANGVSILGFGTLA